MKMYKVKLTDPASTYENIDGYLASFDQVSKTSIRGVAQRKATQLGGKVESFEQHSYLLDFKITGSGEASKIAEQLMAVANLLANGDFNPEDSNEWEDPNIMTEFSVADPIEDAEIIKELEG